MSEQSKSYLKSRFEAGDVPSSQDFQDLIDSTYSVGFSSLYTTVNTNSSDWTIDTNRLLRPSPATSPSNSNTSVGPDSMGDLTSGSKGSGNTSVGDASSFNLNDGIQNTAAGASSLYFIRDGSYNSALGALAGYSVEDGSKNVLLGHSADVDTGSRNKSIAIGYGAITAPVDGSLSIGGNTASTAMQNLTASTAGFASGKFLNIWLNGQQFKIQLLNPS